MAIDETRRVFSVDDVGDFYISTPTADDVRGGDLQYSRSYNKSLFEGIATAGEIKDILQKRGIIGDAYDAHLQELRDTITEKVVAMELEKDRGLKRALAGEVSKIREELFQWSQRVNSPLAHSCEQMAEDQRLEYLVSCVVQNKEGARVWPTFEAYLKESNRVLSFRARFETLIFLQGLQSNFLETTPENIVLKELEEAEAKETELREEVPPTVEVAPETTKKRVGRKAAKVAE